MKILHTADWHLGKASGRKELSGRTENRYETTGGYSRRTAGGYGLCSRRYF